MKIEFKGGKVFRDDVLVGAVWCFMDAWFSRVFAEANELGSRKFHTRENAEVDAGARVAALSSAEAAPKPGSTPVPLIAAPEVFSD